MAFVIPKYLLIEDQEGMRQFEKENTDISWLCFDTEFVGEKRYFTRLCLIQIITENGVYLIDPIKLDSLDYFLQLVTDPAVEKITHAGDNDYRLLYSVYGIIPKNVFDTQIAAGLLDYKYPISFRKLVETELNKFLKKGYAVADWEKRPFQEKQLKYALNDVLPLPDLWNNLRGKLADRGRTHWAKEEFEQFENEAFYYRDPHKEALNSNLMRALNPKERVFLLRLFGWRNQQAREKDYSKEMVLPGKMISQIVRTINAGKEALRQNRRIPGKISDRFGDTFEQLFNKPVTQEEEELLLRIPSEMQEDPKEEVILEMLFLLIKYRCLDNGVSPNMVLTRNTLKKLKIDSNSLSDSFLNGWRNELLGEQFIHWLKNFEHLELDINGGNIELKLKD